ncbi:hypothetical protein PoHVEF18_001111 [Penicillium ochrochloron]
MRPSTTTDPESFTSTTLPPPPSKDSTPMDHAIRELVLKLRPYGLTKAEVLTIMNLGIGLSAGESEDQGGDVNGEGVMDVDGGNGHVVNGGEHGGVDGEGEGEGGEEADYGALALFDAVIEEREERISEEDLVAILGIIRETLGDGYRG